MRPCLKQIKNKNKKPHLNHKTYSLQLLIGSQLRNGPIFLHTLHSFHACFLLLPSSVELCIASRKHLVNTFIGQLRTVTILILHTSHSCHLPSNGRGFLDPRSPFEDDGKAHRCLASWRPAAMEIKSNVNSGPFRYTWRLQPVMATLGKLKQALDQSELQSEIPSENSGTKVCVRAYRECTSHTEPSLKPQNTF